MTKQEICNAPKCAGIYSFKNTINNKHYVGQAIKLRQRLLNHWNSWNSSKMQHLAIYRAFAKYGIEAFELKIEETILDSLAKDTKDKLDALEKEYIQKYNSYENGYNMTLGGDAGVFGLKQTEETSKHISEVVRKHNFQKEIPPEQWVKAKNLETGYEYISISIIGLADLIGIDRSRISKCLHKHQNNCDGKWVFAFYREEYPELEKYKIVRVKTQCSVTESFKVPTKCKESKIVKTAKEIPENYAKLVKLYTPSDLAKRLGVCKKTIYNWNKKIGVSFGLHRSIVNYTITDTETKEQMIMTLEEASKFFQIKEGSFRKQAQREGLYRKRYIININHV